MRPPPPPLLLPPKKLLGHGGRCGPLCVCGRNMGPDARAAANGTSHASVHVHPSFSHAKHSFLGVAPSPASGINRMPHRSEQLEDSSLTTPSCATGNSKQPMSQTGPKNHTVTGPILALAPAHPIPFTLSSQQPYSHAPPNSSITPCDAWRPSIRLARPMPTSHTHETPPGHNAQL